MRIVTTAVAVLALSGVATGAALAASPSDRTVTGPVTLGYHSGTANPASGVTPIRFAPGGDHTKVSGTLAQGGERHYEFVARAFQHATIDFHRSDATTRWSLVDPLGVPLTDNSQSVSHATVELPADGTYRLTVRTTRAAAYNLAMTIPVAVTADPTTRIRFAPGTDHATIRGSLGTQGYRTYVFRASAGQRARVDLTAGTLGNDGGGVPWDLVAPDGDPLRSPAPEARDGIYTLPQTGDYEMTVVSGVPASYRLMLTIPPR